MNIVRQLTHSINRSTKFYPSRVLILYLLLLGLLECLLGYFSYVYLIAQGVAWTEAAIATLLTLAAGFFAFNGVLLLMFICDSDFT